MFKEIWLTSKTWALWAWLVRVWETSFPGRLLLGWFYGLEARARYFGGSRGLKALQQLGRRALGWVRNSRLVGLFHQINGHIEANPHPYGTFLVIAALSCTVLAFFAHLKLVALASTTGLLALAGIALLIRPKLGLVIIPLFSLIDFLFRSFDPLGPLAKSWDDVVLAALLAGLFLQTLRPGETSGTAPRRQEGSVGSREVIANRLSNPLVLPLVFFIFSTVLAAIANKVPLGEGLNGIRVLIQSMLFLIPGWYLVREQRDLRQVIQLMLLAAVLVALYGIWQYWVGLQTPEGWIQKTLEKDLKTRVFSVLGNPNGLGGFLILFIPVSVSLYFASRGILAKVYYGAITGVMMLALGYTYSRGAWIGVAGGLFFFALLQDKRLAIPAVAVAIGAPVLKPDILQRFAVLLDPKYLEASERFGRIFVWSKSLELIGRYPLFGVGPGMFKYHVYNKFGWIAYAAENYFLQIGVEAGLVGLFAFVWLLLAFFKYSSALLRGAWGTRPPDPFTRAVVMGVMAGTVAVAIQNLTTNIWGVLIVSVLNWFLLGAVLAAGRFSHE